MKKLFLVFAIIIGLLMIACPTEPPNDCECCNICTSDCLGDCCDDCDFYDDSGNDDDCNVCGNDPCTCYIGGDDCNVCGNDPCTCDEPNVLISPEEVSEFLASDIGGNSVDNAIDLIVQFPLGIMTASNSGWQQLLSVIEDSGKYVNLDLSACEMEADGIFDPDYTVEDGKEWIVSLILPDAATIIADGDWYYLIGAFGFFSNLMEIFGENVETIGDLAFVYVDFNEEYIGNLTIVNFPEVTSIGEYAFALCTSLVEVNFPLVESIGNNAFMVCTSLVEVNFPKAVSIGSEAFAYCESLVEVNFPVAESIGDRAFNECTSLVEVNFPVAESIGDGAFSLCTSLVEVNFPLVEIIGHSAFYGCTSLSIITIAFDCDINVNSGIRGDFYTYYKTQSKTDGTYIFDGDAWTGPF